MRRWFVAGLTAVAVAVAALSGCGSTAAGGSSRASPAGAAPASAAGPPCVPAAPSAGAPGASGAAGSGGPVGSAAPGSAPGGPALPDLALPCLNGGSPVRLGRLGVPAVVNLWATWCGPCRQELPEFQRYADRAGDRVRVVGVLTLDRASAGRPYAAELGLRFPMLVDADGRLFKATGAAGMPVTLFVDASGRVAYRYNAEALDEAGVARLAAQHLGVVV